MEVLKNSEGGWIPCLNTYRNLPVVLRGSPTSRTTPHAKSRSLSRARPGPSCEWWLWLGPSLEQAKAASGQAKAGAFGPSQAGTSLYRTKLALEQRGITVAPPPHARTTNNGETDMVDSNRTRRTTHHSPPSFASSCSWDGWRVE
jgi:hypothetical protein